MKSYFLEKGPELIGFFPQYHWAKEDFEIEGDSILAFIAPNKNIQFYRSSPSPHPDKESIHFMIEIFDITEREFALFQRLFATLVITHAKIPLFRKGAEVYLQTTQLSTTKSYFRQISSFFYMSIPLIPSKKMDPLWYYDLKNLTITIMQAFSQELKEIKYGLPS